MLRCFFVSVHDMAPLRNSLPPLHSSDQRNDDGIYMTTITTVG
jgi:hypothetical protein